jgi:hypothetical protein
VGFNVCYADACSPPICHVPEPGKPDDVWWFGFDCAHAFDRSPGMDAFLKITGFEWPEHPEQPVYFRRTYKTLAYVQERANALAEWLAAEALQTHENR